MSRTTCRMLVAGLALAAACAGPVAPASADRPFAARYQSHARGDLARAGNTLLSCPAAAAGCATVQAGAGGSRQNNNWTMAWVDADSDADTFNSSSATLSLPAGATVTFAGLYWGADTVAGAGGAPATAPAFAGTALLDTPAAGGYAPVSGSQHDLAGGLWPGRYQTFADVTGEVQAAGAGDYTLANVQASTGTDRYAGWTLVVAYRAPGEPIRNVTVYDGLATVEGTASSSLTLDDFETPSAGTVQASLGFVAYEGDFGITGDGAALNGTTLTDAVNPANNFFNSSIAAHGTRVSAKNPDYVEQLGFDSDVIGVDGLIPAGATSADLLLSTSGDTYFVGVLTLVTDQVPEAPSNDALPTLSGTATDGETLSADPGAWSGTEPTAFDYQWQRCDAAGDNCVDISGANGSTYELGEDDAGHTVRVEVTATNEEGTQSALSDPSAVVAAVAPSNDALPTLSGTATDGETLTADPGEWDGTGPFDYDYQWQRCDAAGDNCVDIPGATGSTYELGDDDAGQTVRVEVTATNEEGTQTALSDPSAVVAAVAPSNDVPPTLSGTARAGETLTADPGSWDGTGPFDYEYQWQRCDAAGDNCVDIPGATGPTYEPTSADVGSTVRVVVTVTNPADSATQVSEPSAPVLVQAEGPGSGSGAGNGSGGGNGSGAGNGSGGSQSGAGDGSGPREGSAAGPGAVPDLGLGSLPGSLVAPDSCQQVTGSQVLAFQVPGRVRFRIRVAPNGLITAERPLRARSPVKPSDEWRLNMHVRRVAYRLGGRRIALRKRAPYAVTIGPALLARASRQTLTVRMVPRRGKPRVARVQLNSRPCSEVFSVVHRPSPARSLLGLRIDSVTPLTGVVFRVPRRLLSAPGTRGLAGKLRVRVAGSRALTYRLRFPRRGGRAATLLAGAGRPRVEVSGGKVTVSGLPAATGGIRLRLRARGMLVTPRVTLRALVQVEGAARRLTQRLGRARR